MKVVVDKIPKQCTGCLFLGSIREPALFGGNDKFYTGCTLLKMKIGMELANVTRPMNCPLTKG